MIICRILCRNINDERECNNITIRSGMRFEIPNFIIHAPINRLTL